MVSAPSYSTLVSGLDPAQTGKMTSTLSAHGHQLPAAEQRHRDRRAVQPDAPQARVALAGAGLLGNTQPGFELFEKQSLGESNFQQQVTYQRALQGQLAETIDSVQGVSGAQVELVLPSPQNQVFGESQGASSAAVLLSRHDLARPELGARASRSSSPPACPGLQLSKVTITDASRPAAVAAASGGAGGSGGTSLQEAEQRYDQSMAASLDAMLAQTLGPGKAQVLVYANMNVNQTTQESLELRQGRGAAAAEQERSRRSPAAAPARAARPARANLTAAAGAAGGKSNYKHETTSSTLGVSKTVTHSTIAPGRGRKPARLGAARPLRARRRRCRRSAKRSPTPPASRPSAATRSRSARSPFAKPAAPRRAAPRAACSAMPSTRCSAIGAAVFLFFTTRSLRRREQEAIDGAACGCASSRRRCGCQSSNAKPRTPPDRGRPSASERRHGNGNGRRAAARTIRRQVEQLADSDPDRVAQQLRSWMQEG